MEKIALRESHAPYTVTLDDKALQNEVTFVDQNGATVAVLLPAKLYESFRAWQQGAQPRDQSPQMAAFARERAAFEGMLPQLLQEHLGKVVVVYQGNVVAVGDEVGSALEEVYRHYGYVPCYAGRVEAPPHIYRFPHRKVIR
jgi:hypothetical protein